jgi:hypothetical protein
MTDSKFIALRMRHGSPLFGACAAVVLVAMAVAPTSVLAAAQVSGSPEAVSLEAQDTSIEEILAALRASFGVHYQSPAKLEKRLTGTYSGSLQRVVMSVLQGYNFITKAQEGRLEIIVLGTHPVAAGASPVSKAGADPPTATSESTRVAERPTNTPLSASIKVTDSRNASVPAAPVPHASGSSAPLVSAPQTSAVAPPMLLTPQAPGSTPPLVSAPQTSAVAPPMLLTSQTAGSAPPLVSAPQTSGVAPPMLLTPSVGRTGKP